MDNYERLIPANVEVGLKQNEPITEIEVISDEYNTSDDQKMVIDGDGNVEIELSDPETSVDILIDSAFDDNLVELLIEDEIDEIADHLVARYEDDRVARERRDEQCEEGLRRAGLDDEASPGSADFEGSSRVVHPMIAENCIDFAAREVKELAPANGPVKAKIPGKPSLEKIEVSQRKVDFMNIQITEYMPYRENLEKMLSQLGIGGSQFIKFWHDDYLKRPNCEFIPIDMVYIPFECNNFYTAERITLRTTIGSVEYWRRCKNGIYNDPDFFDELEEGITGQISSGENESRTERTNNLIEGKSENNSSTDIDSIDLLEIYAYLMIDGDSITQGEYAPYIVTIKEETSEVISIYRNWHEKDKKRFKLDYLVKFDFIPWRGPYALGLAQIIGSLSVAATGALRSLLDSAFVNNIPTALADKGLKMAGQSPDIVVGGITYIEGSVGPDGDLRKKIIPLPFNQPSQTLFSLLEWLTNSAAKVVKMPDGALDNMGDRTPATTTLASIEQNSMTQSAIHQRLHFAQAKCFKIIARLNADYFDPNGYPTEIIEDLQVDRDLFKNTSDIVPVSDPNIFTEMQRYAQIQMVSQLDTQFPGMVNKFELLKRSLVMAKVPDPELLLNVPTQVGQANAVAENMAVCLGQSIGVFPNQNHLDHIRVHAAFLQDPAYGNNPLFSSQMSGLIQHLAEHLVYAYASGYQTLAEHNNKENIIISKHDNGDFDKELVEMTPIVMEALHKELAQYEPLLKELMQKQQQAQQASMENNPEMAKIAVEKEKIQTQMQVAQMNIQQDQQKLQSEMQIQQQTLQVQQQNKQLEAKVDSMETQGNLQSVQTEMVMKREADKAKMDIELMKLAIEQLESLTAIQTDNSALEWEQWRAVKEQIEKVNQLSQKILGARI